MEKLRFDLRYIALVVLALLVAVPVFAAPPVANDDNYTTPFETQLSIAAPGVLGNDTDPDGDSLTAVILTVPTNGSITFRPTGEFTYTPNDDFSGTDSFTYRATDGTEQSEPATVTIAVEANESPVANNDSYETEFEQALTVEAPGVLENDTDPADLSLTAILATNPINGTVALSPSGAFTYTPNQGFSGIDTFTYRASNGTEQSEPATVTITVAANPPPVAEDDSYEVPFGQVLTVGAPGILGNDTDENDDPLTAILVESPGNGSLTLMSNGGFTYTPNNNYFGMDSFTYRASDGTSQSEVATVTLMVLSPPPTNLSLVGSLSQGEARPTFIWSAPVDNLGRLVPVQWYNLVVVRQSDDTTILNRWYSINEACQTETNCSVRPGVDVLPVGFMNGSYSWAVRSWNNNLFSTYSNVSTFTVNVPTPLVPTNFAVSADTGRPILTVPNDVNTTWFHVYVGTQDLELQHIAWYAKRNLMCSDTACTLIPDVHPVNGNYLVYVQSWGPGGFNQDDSTAWAGPRNFSLNAPPAGAITPLTTTVGEGNFPTFQWQAASNATWYQLWVGTPGPSFNTWHVMWYPATDLNCNGGGVCTVTPMEESGLLSGVTYTYYVQSWGPGGINRDLGLQGWVEGNTFTP